MNNANFTPFDITCYTKLAERFDNIFEPQLINEICKNGITRNFNPGDIIVDVAHRLTHIPLVISGSVKIMTENKDGDELLLYYLELGETCAVTLNCCTNNAKSSVKAIAETTVELLMIPSQLMETWMIKYSSWRNYVLDSYNQRLSEMVGAIDTIVFHSLEDRLKKYLEDKVWISREATINITHQEIANDLFASRVAISRIMKKLEKDYFLVQGRNQVTLTKYQS